MEILSSSQIARNIIADVMETRGKKAIGTRLKEMGYSPYQQKRLKELLHKEKPLVSSIVKFLDLQFVGFSYKYKGKLYTANTFVKYVLKPRYENLSEIYIEFGVPTRMSYETFLRRSSEDKSFRLTGYVCQCLDVKLIPQYIKKK